MVCYICENPSHVLCTYCTRSICEGHTFVVKGAPSCRTCDPRKNRTFLNNSLLILLGLATLGVVGGGFYLLFFF